MSLNVDNIQLYAPNASAPINTSAMKTSVAGLSPKIAKLAQKTAAYCAGYGMFKLPPTHIDIEKDVLILHSGKEQFRISLRSDHEEITTLKKKAEKILRLANSFFETNEVVESSSDEEIRLLPPKSKKQENPSPKTEELSSEEKDIPQLSQDSVQEEDPSELLNSLRKGLAESKEENSRLLNAQIIDLQEQAEISDAVINILQDENATLSQANAKLQKMIAQLEQEKIENEGDISPLSERLRKNAKNDISHLVHEQNAEIQKLQDQIDFLTLEKQLMPSADEIVDTENNIAQLQKQMKELETAARSQANALDEQILKLNEQIDQLKYENWLITPTLEEKEQAESNSDQLQKRIKELEEEKANNEKFIAYLQSKDDYIFELEDALMALLEKEESIAEIQSVAIEEEGEIAANLQLLDYSPDDRTIPTGLLKRHIDHANSRLQKLTGQGKNATISWWPTQLTQEEKIIKEFSQITTKAEAEKFLAKRSPGAAILTLELVYRHLATRHPIESKKQLDRLAKLKQQLRETLTTLS